VLESRGAHAVAARDAPRTSAAQHFRRRQGGGELDGLLQDARHGLAAAINAVALSDGAYAPLMSGVASHGDICIHGSAYKPSTWVWAAVGLGKADAAVRRAA
jgi:hypothetical protein